MKEGWRSLDTDYERQRREANRKRVMLEQDKTYYELFGRHENGVDNRAKGPLEIPADATPEPPMPGERIDESYINLAAAILRPGKETKLKP